MKLLLLATLALTGCHTGMEAVPLYVGLGASVLTVEMQIELQTLDNVELAERERIMHSVVPILVTLTATAEAYHEALEAEMAERE